jgi:hypothetical protein
MIEMRSAYKFLARKPAWKRALGEFKRKWEVNIKTDLE